MLKVTVKPHCKCIMTFCTQLVYIQTYLTLMLKLVAHLNNPTTCQIAVIHQ